MSKIINKNINVNINYKELLEQEELYRQATPESKKLMLQYSEEFKEICFVQHMGDKPAIIMPSKIKKLVPNNDGTETETEDFTYSYQTIENFKNSYKKDNFEVEIEGKYGNYKEKKYFADFWLETRSKICNSFRRAVFDPNPKFNDPSLFNLWTGFVKPIKGDVSNFVNHIDNLIEGTKEEKAHIIKLIAYTVKFPHIKTDTTIILQGKQGTGKTTVSETIRALCPNHTSIVDNLKELLSGFNQEYHHTKYFLHEESIFSGDKETNEKIKPLITGSTRKSRIKNVSSVSLDNYSFHIFTSNNDNPVRIENTDRRHNAFNCTDKLKGKRKYFEAYYDWLNNGGANALVHFFQNDVNFQDFSPKDSIETTAKNLIKAQNFDPIENFIFNCLSGETDLTTDNEGKADKRYSFDKWLENEICVSRQGFYEEFEYFHKRAGRNIVAFNQNKFNLKLAEIFKFPKNFMESWNARNVGRHFKLPTLAEARSLFAEYVKISHFESLMSSTGYFETEEDKATNLMDLLLKPTPTATSKEDEDLTLLGIKPMEYKKPEPSTTAPAPIQAVAEAQKEYDPLEDKYTVRQPQTERQKMLFGLSQKIKVRTADSTEIQLLNNMKNEIEAEANKLLEKIRSPQASEKDKTEAKKEYLALKTDLSYSV